MLFNSIEFFIYLPIVFCVYWMSNGVNIRFQNIFILISSYFFYGWWDWRFLLLIAISSLVDYSVGIRLGIETNIKARRLLLCFSVIVNIGILFYFKYFNFFTENFCAAFTFFGKPVNDPVFINIVLPIGISFYTFQTLSYSIDTYRGKIQPTKDIIAFFTFVSFFPQLVAGPIERATKLLPQFYSKRVFKYNEASDGMRQILCGLFKKVVIADNCGIHANDIFSNYVDYSGSTLLLGAVFFALQIYCDFSGYSDIAIGTSRLFGFNLSRNFSFPYFSRDIAEFWRRWHISLSSWFRDYVYIPIGGSKGGVLLTIRNIFIIFIVSGFWHGANWTFIIWGVLNALYFIPIMILKRNRLNLDTVAKGSMFPSVKEITQMASTFFLTVVAWVFFRSETVIDAFLYLSKMFSVSLFAFPDVFPKKDILLVFLFLSVEWIQRNKQHALQFENSDLPLIFRWSIYYIIIFCVFQMQGVQQQFIYFQF